MNRAQRTIATLYLLVLAASGSWVPWKASIYYPPETPADVVVPEPSVMRFGYGWIWEGPVRMRHIAYDSSGIEARFLARSAEPDLDRVLITILALTGSFAAVFCACGFVRHPAIEQHQTSPLQLYSDVRAPGHPVSSRE